MEREINRLIPVLVVSMTMMLNPALGAAALLGYLCGRLLY
jgi:hypothetical protein